LQDGNKITDSDSAEMLKKSFIKSNFDSDQLTGFTIKLERFTKSDYKIFSGKEELSINKEYDWDGKILIIDTETFNSEYIDKMLSAINRGNSESSEKTEAEKQQMKAMMSKLNMKMTSTLKFENKIKNIIGKHDWITQIDDYSIKINYDVSKILDDDFESINGDKKIIITTE
jgi:hypothetical protein